jgi:hypothetical protein
MASISIAPPSPSVKPEPTSLHGELARYEVSWHAGYAAALAGQPCPEPRVQGTEDGFLAGLRLRGRGVASSPAAPPCPFCGAPTRQTRRGATLARRGPAYTCSDRGPVGDRCLGATYSWSREGLLGLLAELDGSTEAIARAEAEAVALAWRLDREQAEAELGAWLDALASDRGEDGPEPGAADATAWTRGGAAC